MILITPMIVLSYQIVGLQYSMIRQLIQQWETFNKEIPEVPDKHSRETLFSGYSAPYLSGNWVLWLKLLRSYSIGVEPPVTIPETQRDSVYINGRAILDGLFTHLNIIFDRDEL